MKAITYGLFAAGLLAAMMLATAQAKEAQPSPDKAKQSAQDLELIYQLAVRPVGIVQGDRCEIRGAVWGNGPRPGVKQALVNVITGETFRTKTGASGTYSLSIPYKGHPIVLAERVEEEVYVKQEFATTAKITNGGVVCDHRLKTQVAQAHNHKETK